MGAGPKKCASTAVLLRKCCQPKLAGRPISGGLQIRVSSQNAYPRLRFCPTPTPRPHILGREGQGCRREESLESIQEEGQWGVRRLVVAIAPRNRGRGLSTVVARGKNGKNTKNARFAPTPRTTLRSAYPHASYPPTQRCVRSSLRASSPSPGPDKPRVRAQQLRNNWEALLCLR